LDSSHLRWGKPIGLQQAPPFQTEGFGEDCRYERRWRQRVGIPLFKRRSSVSQFFYLRRIYGTPQRRMAIWIVLCVQPNRHSRKVRQKSAQIKKRRPK
jgi:hypothetical protein